MTRADNERVELLPCPHGKEARVLNIGGDRPFSIVVRPPHPCVNSEIGWFADRAEAITAWNTRAALEGAQVTDAMIRIPIRDIALKAIKRARKAGESEEMLARWISDDVRAAMRSAAPTAAPDEDAEWLRSFVSAYENDISGISYDKLLQIANRLSRSADAVLVEALKPFAKLGQMLDGPFGPALFKDEDAIGVGGAWLENGEPRTVTFGDLRRAAAALASTGTTNGGEHARSR